MKKIITLALVTLVMLGCKKKEEIKGPTTLSIYYQFEVEYYSYSTKKWVLATNLEDKYWIEVSYTKPDGTISTKKFYGSKDNNTKAYSIAIEEVFPTDGSIQDVELSWKSNLNGSGNRLTAYIKRFVSTLDITYNDGILFRDSDNYIGSGRANIKSKAF